MKWLSILFSFYILALASMPCGDKKDCPGTDRFETSNHDDHDHETESCSPFCTCSCCGASVQLVKLYCVELNVSEVSTPLVVHTTEHTSEVSISVWQPPKIG